MEKKFGGELFSRLFPWINPWVGEVGWPPTDESVGWLGNFGAIYFFNIGPPIFSVQHLSRPRATTQGCPYTHSCPNPHKKCPLSNGFSGFKNFKTLKINTLFFLACLMRSTFEPTHKWPCCATTSKSPGGISSKTKRSAQSTFLGWPLG